MHRLIILAGILAGALAPVALSAPATVVLGQKMHQAETGYQNCPPDEDENTICMTSWFRWTILIERTVRGPSLPRRIVAVIGQHTTHIVRKPYPHSLFVLVPIEDPQMRERLRASYIVEEESVRFETYCLQSDPKEIGLDVEVLTDGKGSFCFGVPPTD